MWTFIKTQIAQWQNRYISSLAEFSAWKTHAWWMNMLKCPRLFSFIWTFEPTEFHCWDVTSMCSFLFIFIWQLMNALNWLIQKHSAAADITESLSEDQVPEAFLVMLLIQFSTMIVDRALYLRKTLLGKCVFQVVLVFGIHFWMFFILPGVTERWGITEEVCILVCILIT